MASSEATAGHGHAGGWTPAKVGMVCFLVSEAAFFGTLIVTYVAFLNQTVRSTPGPADVFELGSVLLMTACLLASSVTVHFADRLLRGGNRQGFLLCWGATIVLGVLFLVGTAHEWYQLIDRHGLTISRNMFGSTYFTLVGFHAAHVSVGVVVMAILFALVLRRRVTERNATAVELVSWYWHFVDGVWLVVFTLVYVVGR